MDYIYSRKGEGFGMQSEELLEKIESTIKDWTKDVDQCFNNADPVISSIAKRTTKVYGNSARWWREDGIEKVIPLASMYLSIWFYESELKDTLPFKTITEGKKTIFLNHAKDDILDRFYKQHGEYQGLEDNIGNVVEYNYKSMKETFNYIRGSISPNANFLIVSHHTESLYIDYLKENGEYPQFVEVVGRTCLKFNDTCNMYSTEMVDDLCAYAINTEDFEFQSFGCGFEWLKDSEGKILRQTHSKDEQGNIITPAYNGVMAKYFCLICSKPREQTKFIFK